MALSSDHRAVLRILDGCPCGATDYNLSTRFNVSMQTMVDLAKARLVSVREHRLAHGGTQCWVCITPAGQAALGAATKDLHQKVRDVISSPPPLSLSTKDKSHV